MALTRAGSASISATIRRRHPAPQSGQRGDADVPQPHPPVPHRGRALPRTLRPARITTFALIWARLSPLARRRAGALPSPARPPAHRLLGLPRPPSHPQPVAGAVLPPRRQPGQVETDEGRGAAAAPTRRQRTSTAKSSPRAASLRTRNERPTLKRRANRDRVRKDICSIRCPTDPTVSGAR